MAKPSAKPWVAVPYIEPNGESDVLDYLDKLKTKNLRQRKHLDQILEQFAVRGPFAVGAPYWKSQDGGFFAIRWGGRHRVYCYVDSKRQIVMLVAVWKLWPTFSHLRLCQERRADFETAAYDQEHRQLKYQARRQKRGNNGPA